MSTASHYQGPIACQSDFIDDIFISSLCYFHIRTVIFYLLSRFTTTFIQTGPTIFSIVVSIDLIFIPFVILSYHHFDNQHFPCLQINITVLLYQFLTGGFSFVMINSIFRHLSIPFLNVCRTEKHDVVGVGQVCPNICPTLCLYSFMSSPFPSLTCHSSILCLCFKV